MLETTIQKKQEDRYLLLLTLYKMQDRYPVSIPEVAQETGLYKSAILAASDYLADEGLIEQIGDEYPAMEITHKGLVEVERSLASPKQPTEYFTPTVIQHFNAPVYGVQSGGQHNTQNVSVVINHSFNEGVDKLIAVLRSSDLPDLDKEDAVQAVERVRQLAGKEKTPDVIKRAKDKLDIVKTAIEVSDKMAAIAMPYLKVLVDYFT